MTTETADDEAARLRAEIEQARADLGGSVDALAAKLDVAGRVQDAAKSRAEAGRQVAESVVGSVLGLVRGGVVAGIDAGISVVRWTAGTVLGVGAQALKVADALRRRVARDESQRDGQDHPA